MKNPSFVIIKILIQNDFVTVPSQSKQMEDKDFTVK